MWNPSSPEAPEMQPGWRLRPRLPERTASCPSAATEPCSRR